ncbi:MarR family winged helix-turn-helix transcriptional regulator [Halobacillus sp. B23F22_1]|uniref:MarR family winged helix-turn-helix transcriptional regulator n=1 Tax=Halobacillus sp. B23F22_1 TaxID=3459514 RepID=UPI00373ED18C
MSLVFHHILQLSREVNYYLNEALKDEEIFMSHWAVIFQLHEHGLMTQTELKERLNVEAPPLSRTISRLLDLGFIEKYASSDKRTNNIKLSSSGEFHYERWKALIKEAEEVLLQELGEQRKKELDEHVKTLSNVLRKIKGGE